MRIESNAAYSSYGQRPNRHSSDDLFESTLLKTEKKDEKAEEKKGKLVTAREGAYVRQYLVGADGSKILLSEMKQAEAETTSTDAYSPQAIGGFNLTENGMSRNTQETLNLLNLQIGAGIPLIPNKSLIKAED
jgi:hypothetical protein